MLSRIQNWLDDKDAELVFLLRGMAGTGKSSIAKTVATTLDRACRIGTWSSAATAGVPGNAFLAGSFFFRHSNNNRNSLQRLFTTIAASLAQRVPAMRKHIAAAIRNNPDIGAKFPQEQINCLLLGPLALVDQSLPFVIAPVVVIDALDECANLGGAASLVTLLAGLQNLSKARLRFILTSRPDADIEPQPNSTLCKTVELKKIEQVSGKRSLRYSDDITRLLVHDMAEIATKYYRGEAWLQEDDIQRLAQRADGLFIYAATISRFLGGKIADSTRRGRLDAIFDQKSVNNRFSPDAALNNIYSSVLGFPHLDLTEEEKIANFRPALAILGCISFSFEPVLMGNVCKFFDLTGLRAGGTFRHQRHCSRASPAAQQLWKQPVPWQQPVPWLLPPVLPRVSPVQGEGGQSSGSIPVWSTRPSSSRASPSWRRSSGKISATCTTQAYSMYGYRAFEL